MPKEFKLGAAGRCPNTGEIEFDIDFWHQNYELS
jgi:hypothetical protein